MGLSSDLISQFVKATNDNAKNKKETSTVYGTVTGAGSQKYVQLDGSETSTPVSTTVDVKEGDRVIVMIKNHSATITGNLGDPAASSQTVYENAAEVSKKITELDIAIAKRVTTEQLNAETARITKELIAKDVIVQDTLTASIVEVENKLTAKDVEITGRVEANEGHITDLEVNKLSVEDAKATYATIGNLQATDAYIHNLESAHANFEITTTSKLNAHDASINDLNTKKLDAESAKITYANIDFSNIGKAAIEEFFSKSGMITNLVVGDGTITGELVGVTISGDLIKGNTVKADKLVVKGSDGLYYKLNIEAGATTSTTVSESDLQNGLHGTAIIAKTITAEKISVHDLVAFGADIAGFHITNQNTFYSGVKSSVNNTTQGIYMDATGQMNVGDGSNFMKYYKAADGSYKLEISANSIILSSSGKTVENAINEVKNSVNDIEIGGRNLLQNSRLLMMFSNNSNTYPISCTEMSENGVSFCRVQRTDIENYPNTTLSIYSSIPKTSFAYAEMTGKQVTLSFKARVSHEWTGGFMDFTYGGDSVVDFGKPSEKFTTEWKTYYVVIDEFPDLTDRTGIRWNPYTFQLTADVLGDFYLDIRDYKFELGNKPTDWTPAPEDMATAKEAATAQTTANSAEEKASNAQTLIAQLSESISMLVTDGNGTSLMTQTEDGWTFSTANIQNLVNSVSEGLSSLIEDVGDVNDTVNILKQAVHDLGEIAEYVSIGTYEGEPCIELGEGDSEFKLRITNTRMMFTEGANILAYFNNQSLHIKKAVVEEELQQGGFVWQVRSNGNLGLIWKGGNS